MNQESFANAIAGLKELAKAYENVLAMEDIREELKELALSQAQLEAVCDYLIENKIEIADYQKGDNEIKDIPENQEDSKFLKMYMEEIQDLQDISEECMTALFPKAVAGDSEARQELIYGYLNRIVDFARIYRGQGVLLEDLIQEGNIGLLSALTSVKDATGVENVEQYLAEQICKAMEEAVYNVQSEEDTEDYLVKQMEEVERYITEFEKEQNRKPTAEELAKAMKKSEEEVKDIMKYLK